MVIMATQAPFRRTPWDRVRDCLKTTYNTTIQ
jgi:hypothetical protein